MSSKKRPKRNKKQGSTDGSNPTKTSASVESPSSISPAILWLSLGLAVIAVVAAIYIFQNESKVTQSKNLPRANEVQCGQFETSIKTLDEKKLEELLSKYQFVDDKTKMNICGQAIGQSKKKKKEKGSDSIATFVSEMRRHMNIDDNVVYHKRLQILEHIILKNFLNMSEYICPYLIEAMGGRMIDVLKVIVEQLMKRSGQVNIDDCVYHPYGKQETKWSATNQTLLHIAMKSHSASIARLLLMSVSNAQKHKGVLLALDRMKLFLNASASQSPAIADQEWKHLTNNGVVLQHVLKYEHLSGNPHPIELTFDLVRHYHIDLERLLTTFTNLQNFTPLELWYQLYSGNALKMQEILQRYGIPWTDSIHGHKQILLQLDSDVHDCLWQNTRICEAQAEDAVQSQLINTLAPFVAQKQQMLQSWALGHIDKFKKPIVIHDWNEFDLFWELQIPVIVRSSGHSSESPLFNWNDLIKRFGHVKLMVGDIPYAPLFYEMIVKDVKHLQSSLYAFDGKILHENKHLLQYFTRLQNVSDVFKQKGVHFYTDIKYQLAIGSVGSGSPPHWHTPAFNFLFTGEKIWWLFPPASSVYSHIHVKDWFSRHHIGSTINTYFWFVQKPGDVLFIPNEWSHACKYFFKDIKNCKICCHNFEEKNNEYTIIKQPFKKNSK
ncbi:hypothetical protein RFI_11744 [Reticulomyxa filosa]|uniref:JmjC domain-containing protein n=1 Tax=Reticulomyxa filosa TaxID=46433 RepID=X6NJ90_RETFI|nr:hypothetical protein RFI_11744 [Reticulomyxa filosa]|eukprot:ETO25392.1 hypothetical protein RFI_11744 [Reticulomyxa filosa]